MRLLSSKLPSGGVGCTLEFIDVEPLNYLELSKYCSQKSSNEYDDFLWDFETFILTIKDWEKLSSFDTPVLIAYRKMFSVNLKGSYTLTDGTTFTLNDIDFTQIDRIPLSISKVNLNGVDYTPSIKSMKSFYETLLKFRGLTTDLRFPVVASYLGIEEPEVLFNLKAEDVSICERLYTYLLSQPVIKKGGAEAILFGKASELFQNIAKLCRPSEDKIQFVEKV